MQRSSKMTEQKMMGQKTMGQKITGQNVARFERVGGMLAGLAIRVPICHITNNSDTGILMSILAKGSALFFLFFLFFLPPEMKIESTRAVPKPQVK